MPSDVIGYHRVMVSRLLLGLLLGAGCLDQNPNFVGPGSTGGPPSTTTDAATTTTGQPAETTDDPAGTSSASSTPITTMTDPPPTTGETTGTVGTSGSSESSGSSATMTMGGAVCGDGKLEQDEQCDDGNLEDLDECTNKCTSTYCGDSVKQLKEECDDGNMDLFGGCPAKCKVAMCGDGWIRAGVEQCDDGNMKDSDGCDSDCQITPKFVFVTSTLYNGDLDGLLGADMKCQVRAIAGGLPGEYQAWLSDMTGSPSTRMKQSMGRYVLRDGKTVVADNWADLVSGDIDNPITINEYGGFGGEPSDACAKSAVYTNTKPDGTSGGPFTSCENWTFLQGPSWWGDATASDMQWSDVCKGGGCNQKAALYCFQQ